MRSLHDLDVAGKRAFVRADFNVPLEHGRVGDATRIDATLPTLRWLLDHGATLVLASHLGRPKGKRTAELSLRPVADVLSSRLGRPVTLAPDCVGAETEALVGKMKSGDVVLLENLRFHPEEERNDPGFAAQLARLADVYVDDAFGAAHRAHASTVGMVPLVRERAAGLLLTREVEMLSRLMRAPEKPFVAVLGGAKVSDKIGVIEHLLTRVTSFVIGGAMAYTFLRAQGKPVGRSRVEDDKVELARETLTRAAQAGVVVRLPLDHLVADRPEAGAVTRVVPAADFPAGHARRRHRPRDREALRRRDRRCADGALERTDGHLRDRRLQPRYDGRSPRRWPPVAASRSSGAAIRSPRSRAPGRTDADHARLHGRRRVARVPRGTRAARREGPGGLTRMARVPLLAGNWKMHGTRAEATALAGALAKSVGAVVRIARC